MRSKPGLCWAQTTNHKDTISGGCLCHQAKEATHTEEQHEYLDDETKILGNYRVSATIKRTKHLTNDMHMNVKMDTDRFLPLVVSIKKIKKDPKTAKVH